MKIKQRKAARQPESGSATPALSTASHITGIYPGGPSSRRAAGAPQKAVAVRGISDAEERRERWVLRQRRRRRVRHAVEVLIFTLALAISAGAYLGFKAQVSPEEATEKVLRGSGEVDLSKEARRLLNELWKMEDMERLPRR